jgi:hypothetical protein
MKSCGIENSVDFKCGMAKYMSNCANKPERTARAQTRRIYPIWLTLE